jgi:hypothetical protein
MATESNLLGDQMSEKTLSIADDLYHLRIPQLWCQMSGHSAPPLTWGLGQWLTELQSRCHHFERILTLVSTSLSERCFVFVCACVFVYGCRQEKNSLALGLKLLVCSASLCSLAFADG